MAHTLTSSVIESRMKDEPSIAYSLFSLPESVGSDPEVNSQYQVINE
jgi:hypothetical protein